MMFRGLLLLLTLGAVSAIPHRFTPPATSRAFPSSTSPPPPTPAPLIHPRIAHSPINEDPTIHLSPIFVRVDDITDKIITNITINLPSPSTPQAGQSTPIPVPVVGPAAPSHPPSAAPIVSTQPPSSISRDFDVPSGHGSLLSKIHSTPELGLLSMYLSLPLFNNITHDILNQTTNPAGVAPRITVFGPSNIGVLRFLRRMMIAREVVTALQKGENATCDSQDKDRFTNMKSMYEHLSKMSDAFYENTRERSGQAGNIEKHQNLLQSFIPQYQEMFHKANFTEDEKAFMRANLLYHIANSSIHLFDIPSLSFPSTLMNDSRFVLLNSPSHSHPIVPQRLQLVKREEWPGERRVELRFGVPGSGYYKSHVATERHLHNIHAANGILHVIDTIQVLPLNLSATLYLADLFSAFSVLNSTNLLPRVDVTPNITIFIPTDEAIFYSYGYNMIKHNKTLLEHVILHHIVAGVHDTTELSSPLVTYNNDTIIPHRIGIQSFIIEDANIIVPNILFKNGIIHIIDKVLTNPTLLGQPAVQAISPHYPSVPFPLIPPFLPRSSVTATNITCPVGDQVCHIVNVVTNETSPYPTCYNPSTHVCVNNSFLCPHSTPYACGVSCYNITTHECQTLFTEGRLHYILTPRTTPYTTPTYKPAAPTPTCPPGDQICNIMDIRVSTTEAKPQCYNPYTHVCSNNTFLCPVTHPFVCGYHCYDTTFYTCFYTFFNNSFQWILQPTPTLIALQNKTAPTTTPITTYPTPTHPPVHMQPPTQTPIPVQPQPYKPTPTPTHAPVYPPQPTRQPTPHPQPTPTPHPTAPPTTLTCPAGNQVCPVKSTTSITPTCYDPHTYVCADNMFLCPLTTPLLCDKHCYNATMFACVNNMLKQHDKQPTQPTYQPTHQPTHQPTYQPTYQPTQQPTYRPTHQPTHQPTPHPHPQPTPTPTPHPTPSTSACPAGNSVCQVKSPFLASSAQAVPTCYDPHTHVCANATFLCPVSAPLLCDKHCYNATVFECVNHALRLHTPHIQPRLSPLVASHIQPRALSGSHVMTQLPCRVDLTTTFPTTTGRVTVTHASLPTPITIEIPSGITNTPGVTASRVVSMPSGARVALVGEAQLSTILEALMSLPADVRARLSTTLSTTNP